LALVAAACFPPVSGKASNAVFISYRHEVGWMLTEALYRQLTDAGVDAFYDNENIRAGQFDSIILTQIAARPYFMPVLTPGTLDRCANTGDWVRREIKHALETERTIVPVHTSEFDFGDLERFLPRGLGRELARFNSVELSHRWFKQAVQELVEKFLTPVDATPSQTASGANRTSTTARAEPSAAEVRPTLDLSGEKMTEAERQALLEAIRQNLRS
jgi:hypothetical protein